ncbi:DUF3482 domain-containing protein, partial [Pseudomonas amygdali]|uniref:DUF3482 domain-containing protein n=2 Tax=Pseudomonas amygdali TaxID=47877 RepID=UPI000B163456
DLPDRAGKTRACLTAGPNQPEHKKTDTPGHAAIHRMELTTPQDKTWRKGKIPEPLTRARAHPQWSTLNSHAKPNQAERQEAIDELADVVLQD